MRQNQGEDVITNLADIYDAMSDTKTRTPRGFPGALYWNIYK